MQDRAEGGLHLKGSSAPDGLCGEHQAGDNAHLDSRLIAEYRTDLFDPSANKSETIQSEDRTARRQGRHGAGTGQGERHHDQGLQVDQRQTRQQISRQISRLEEDT